MGAKLLLAAWLACLAAPAAAENWWWIGTFGGDDNRMNAYVESESADRPGKDLVRVWVFTHNETPRDNGETRARALHMYNCAQHSWTLVSRLSYDANGTMLGSTIAPQEDWVPVRPNTMGDVAFSVACRQTPALQREIADPLAHSTTILGRQAAAANPGGGEQSEGLSSGTGFFIGPAGYVLTSYHVVDGAGRIACRTGAGEMLPARVVRASPANDLALLQVERRPVSYLTFAAPGSTHSGDRVFTIGFPVIDRLGLEPRFTDGTVSALSMGGENVFMQISIPIQPGNSGGPVVTERGHVVGIIAASEAVEAFYQDTGAFPQNVNWAVKSDYASPLLAPMTPAPVRTREAAIANARNSVCLIIAEAAAPR